jgi:glycine cleavage system protein P-like pyridoxal-binding family
MFVRALAYILANGPDGLRQTTEDAVLNANYIRAKLNGTFELPYRTPTLHEVVFSDKPAIHQWRQDRRHRQAAHRLRLPSLHRQLPHGRAWRA